MNEAISSPLTSQKKRRNIDSPPVRGNSAKNKWDLQARASSADAYLMLLRWKIAGAAGARNHKVRFGTVSSFCGSS